MIVWIILGLLLLIVMVFIAIYNSLIVARSRCKNAWAQIDVQLRKRYDLVPNLVETVKGYAKHERTVFTEITKARSALMKAKGIAEKAKANDMLTGALKTLFAVVENYPKLRASQNFIMLQEQLEGIENKIAYSRQFYNDAVLDYNVKTKKVPYNFIASMFGFKEMEYFEVKEEKARKPVKVKF